MSTRKMGQLILGIVIVGIGGALVWLGGHLASEGWKKWRQPVTVVDIVHDGTQKNTSESNKEDIFKVNFIITMRFKWPGPLLFMYPSALGKTISPVSIALYLEIVNNKPTISRIYSYKCRALLRYDEGGSTRVNQAPGNGMKLEYIPSGKIVEKWRNLYSMGFVGDQMYFVTSNGWNKCKRIDFTNNSLDNLARNIQLKPGESLMGWVFFELEHDLRTQLPEIKEIELTLTNSAGDSQVFKSRQDIKGDEEILHFISAGDWNVLEGFYDLTKEKYSMTPMVDLRRILKEGEAKVVKAKENIKK